MQRNLIGQRVNVRILNFLNSFRKGQIAEKNKTGREGLLFLNTKNGIR
jgi:hypothetical protein